MTEQHTEGRSVGSGRAGEATGSRAELWVLLRALLLLGAGVAVLGWLIS